LACTSSISLTLLFLSWLSFSSAGFHKIRSSPVISIICNNHDVYVWFIQVDMLFTSKVTCAGFPLLPAPASVDQASQCVCLRSRGDPFPAPTSSFKSGSHERHACHDLCIIHGSVLYWSGDACVPPFPCGSFLGVFSWMFRKLLRMILVSHRHDSRGAAAHGIHLHRHSKSRCAAYRLSSPHLPPLVSYLALPAPPPRHGTASMPKRRQKASPKTCIGWCWQTKMAVRCCFATIRAYQGSRSGDWRGVW